MPRIRRLPQAAKRDPRRCLILSGSDSRVPARQAVILAGACHSRPLLHRVCDHLWTRQLGERPDGNIVLTRDVPVLSAPYRRNIRLRERIRCRLPRRLSIERRPLRRSSTQARA